MRTNMEKLIVQIFETKRRIIEQVKQQMDLYDQHLASECLLEGVAPPEWLWSPYFPFQTSEELNKEDIISGLLFPHSRPSIVCPGSRRVSYQQPVALADNAKPLEGTSGFNQPLDKQLLEEEWQYLSCNNLEEIGCSSHCAHEQNHNFASPSNFQEERAQETTATCYEQNASSPFPEYSQDDRVKKSGTAASCAQDIDFTSPGYCQGEGIPNSISTSGCEQDYRITSPEHCQDKIAPNSCPDPALSLARIQRSKSRQRALELRSSVKASKSHSNCRRDLQDPLSENVGSEIPSLRSNINQATLFEHDENDEGRCKAEDATNSDSQGIEKYQDILSSTIVKSRSTCQKAGSIRKSSALDKYASVAPESGCSNSQPETSCMNEITLLQPIGTADEGFAKEEEEEEEKACDPLSKRRDKIVNLDELTRSKDSTAEISSKSKYSYFSKSFSIEDLPSSKTSPRSGYEVDLPNPISGDNKPSMVKKARMSSSQTQKVYSVRITGSRGAAQGCRSKSEHSGCVESSSVKPHSGCSVALLQSDDERQSLKPIRVNSVGLLVGENNSCDKRGIEKGESVDTRRFLISRNLSQAKISRVEPAVASEPVLQKNCGVPGDLVEHSSSDVSSRVKVSQPQSLSPKVGTNPYNGRITRSRRSSRQQELANACVAPCVGSKLDLDSEQLEVRAGGSPSSPSHDLSLLGKPRPHDFDEKEEQNFDEMAMNRQEEPSKGPPLLISEAKGTCEKSLAEEEMCTLEGYDGLKKEWVPVEGLPIGHTVLKAGESEPPEANIGLPVKDISVFCQDALANSLKKWDSLFVPNSLSDVSAELQAPGELNVPKRPIQALCSSSPVVECSQQQNKRRRTVGKLSYRMPASAFPRGDVLDSGSAKKKLGTVERSKEYQNFNDNDVELQKMIGSGSSTQFQLDEVSLFMEAGVKSPDAIIFREEELSRGWSQITLHHGVGSGNTEFMPSTRETSHLLASEGLHDSVDSPHVQPIGLTGSDDESLPVMEGFVIQADDEKQSCSGTQISLDSLKLPKTTVECPNLLEQTCSSTVNTPLLHIPTTLNLNGKLDLFQSVPNGLLEGMLLSNSLAEKYDEIKEPETNSLFTNLGIEHACHGRSHSDCLPLSGGGPSVDVRNPCVSPIGKLWYRNRSMRKSASSMKGWSSSPDLPCIDEENENMDEEAEKLLYRNTPGSANSAKSGSPSPDLPPIIEENVDNDKAAGVICEENHSKMKNSSADRIPLAVVNENMDFPASFSEAKMPDDRQSLESVNTAFSFTATCPSVKSKVRKQNGGKRKCTGKGKENWGVLPGVNGARKNADLLKNRFNEPKLSENSSLTTQGPCLSEKEPGHNNIVSNIISFIPLVQPKPAAAVITGKRDVKVKALEAAEAAKQLAEKKENERKIKKEALKLERARQEQENLKKLELEKKKKEDERKKKETEMAERKRQRAEEEKKLKEAKRKRVAEAHRQQRKPEAKSHIEKGEKESKTQAMDLRSNQVKEHKVKEHKVKDELVNAEKTIQEQANYRIPEARSKGSSASKSSADDLKVGKMSEEAIFPSETIEESYDISPYKCSDDEDEDEDEDEVVPNTKFVPSWASKNCILLTISFQQNADPEKIFPPKSFCSIGEVLMPRNRRSR